MSEFVVTHETSRSPDEAWARLTDWPQHARHVPLTAIKVTTARRDGIGTVFVARTGIGRLGFDDPMEITAWQAPGAGGTGRCRLVKRGRVVTGWAQLSVEPTATGARATWQEDIRVTGLPKLADSATALTSRLLFGRVLRRLLED